GPIVRHHRERALRPAGKRLVWAPRLRRPVVDRLVHLPALVRRSPVNIDHDHETGEQIVPARRLAPKDHLTRAAAASISSDAERYHLDAATGEAAARSEEHLAQIRRALWSIDESLSLATKVLVAFYERGDDRVREAEHEVTSG